MKPVVVHIVSAQTLELFGEIFPSFTIALQQEDRQAHHFKTKFFYSISFHDKAAVLEKILKEQPEIGSVQKPNRDNENEQSIDSVLFTQGRNLLERQTPYFRFAQMKAAVWTAVNAI